MPTLDTIKNRLLRALPPAELRRFITELHPVALTLRQVIYEPGTAIDSVYFMEEGISSVLTIMANGSTIEIGMVGREGMIGIAALLGAETSAQQVIVQVAGSALRMNAVDCVAVFNRSDAVRRVFHRQIEELINLSGQTAACNRLHPVEQRCARWLLMASDRIPSLVMPMTHEFLASMLGVRRAGVTETVGELQRAGLIRYPRGQLTILDRDGLEAMACECYRRDRARFDRAL